MDLSNEGVLLKTKSTLFNLLMRKTSKFLCYERLLNMTYVAYKNAFFREMQFWSHCYTVVSYRALFRLSVYKIPAVYLSGAKNVCFCTIRDFGSPTTTYNYFSLRNVNPVLIYLVIAICYSVYSPVNPDGVKGILDIKSRRPSLQDIQFTGQKARRITDKEYHINLL